jgi:hypothetical protein
VAGRWFSAGTLVSSTNKTDSYDVIEIDHDHDDPEINGKIRMPFILNFIITVIFLALM